MANNLNTNPIVIDTFSADFSIPGPINVTKVVLFSAADGDKLRFEDENGVSKIRVTQIGASDTTDQDFPGSLFCPNGLFFDADDGNSGLDDGTDEVLIYRR